MKKQNLCFVEEVAKSVVHLWMEEFHQVGNHDTIDTNIDEATKGTLTA